MTEIIEKVQKLLSLADPRRGATEAEAQLAAEKAQELCFKHGLDLASISIDEGEDSSLNVEDDFLDLRAGRWRQSLANNVIRSAGARCVWISDYGKHSGKYHIFAAPETIPSIIATFKSLENWIDVNGSLASLNNDDLQVHSRKWERSWKVGATSRISKRLRERAERQKDQARDAGYGQALVLLRDQVEDALSSEYPHLVSRSNSSSVHTGAYSEGYDKGGEADIGDTKIGTGRGQLNA